MMRMLLPAPDLFDAPPLPPGLEYHADFLAPNEETALLQAFADLPFREAKFQQYTARRRVDRYGLLYDEKVRAWVEGRPLPTFLADLRERVASWRGVPHYGTVVGISLSSACRMRFRPHDNQHDRNAVIALPLAPRSLYVLADEIRWAWQHSIPPAKALRYSVTFRTPA